MKNDEQKLLEEEVKLLEHANIMLHYSYKACKEIGIKTAYSFEELDKFEAFTSRFARTSDILIQKLFRLIDRMELETPGSVIDRINRAEKRALIASAETFKEIRYLRNDIAHEYLPSAIEGIFKKVLALSPALMESVEQTMDYASKLK